LSRTPRATDSGFRTSERKPGKTAPIGWNVMSDPSGSEFFEQIRDGVFTVVGTTFGEPGGYAHGYGVKITFGSGDRVKEHYEAQLIRGRLPGSLELEIGFHSEYPKVDRNIAVLELLGAHEKQWRKQLGPEAASGPFFGNDRWRRVSETWDQFDFRDADCAFEVTHRLAEYINAFEPLLKR
jgi:hypothetical protein